MAVSKAMAQAFNQAKVGIAEFLTQWAEDLPSDDMAALDEKLQEGHRLGFHLVTMGKLEAHITLTDPAGAMRILQTIDFNLVRH
ncbi:hypothetical protein [Pandoraea sputorum]|uniref:hypothetical protein n=1 Tax=Pandoraea sputorum TaxID=93222 RepID=UPI00124039BB|nr:hypothetical protein [Pandoraea sputorum]VVE49785.1 hypothetical protein PSP20601_04603 [Pandoraea sputorum]